MNKSPAEPTNKSRAERVVKFLKFYEDEDEDAGAVRDLLIDVFHYCHQNKIDIEYQITWARIYFGDEVADEEGEYL